MKIAIIGDCHGDPYYKNIRIASKENPDYIIVCGDFGYLWTDTINTKKTLEYISKSFTPIILFVDGNHENFFMLNKLEIVDKFGSKVDKVTDKIFHLKRGHIYNIGGKRFFVFGGAYSVDRKFRIKDKSWWEQELPTEEQKQFAIENIEKVKCVEYVITHTVPTRDVYGLGFNIVQDETSDFLTFVDLNLEYEKWFFGHFHVDTTLGNKIGLYKQIYLLEF